MYRRGVCGCLDAIRHVRQIRPNTAGHGIKSVEARRCVFLQCHLHLCFRVTCLPCISKMEDAGARGDVEQSRLGILALIFR